MFAPPGVVFFSAIVLFGLRPEPFAVAAVAWIVAAVAVIARRQRREIGGPDGER